MVNKSTVSNFILQAILVVGLSILMIRTGQIVGARLLAFDIPYAGQLGFILGAVFILAIFAVLRRTYRTYGNGKLGA